jgi:uncharacterized protein YgbK (DUF1537 family)
VVEVVSGGPVAAMPLEVVRNRGAEKLLSALIAEGRRVAIADAETDDDLRALVREVRRVEPNALLVGSGALASALALEISSPADAPRELARQRCRTVLILCGSANPTSRGQLDYLAAECGVSVIAGSEEESNPGELESKVAETIQTDGVAAVCFTTKGNGEAGSALRLQEYIGAFARSVLSKVAIDGLVLTGGETAWTVCREIGGTRFEVLEELEPGAVLSTLTRAGSKRMLVGTKPGGFGSIGVIEGLFRAMVK